ncbi:Hypothetical predicted protein [Paramuricea clavata]|uniref:Uncharacterized protein n=1 Tax=Paramuricea clavata TaxID=317549 RepID=A0A7D9DVJ5_PARCT|nr:Hypothetical predicted protein [Paramuricea clavata]
MAAAFIQHQRKRVLSLLGFALLADEDKEVMPNKRKRQQYMREWIARREEKGVYYQLIRELEVEDHTAYREFFRVSREQFLFLVEQVRPLITKKEQPYPINCVRSTIKPDERVAVTLRFLATGESFHSLEYSFRISRQCISMIIIETCTALFKILGPAYLKTPSSQDEWDHIAEGFRSKWNFPNGLGAIDGKRILIQQPANSGSHFYDYKGNNSIVLLAVFGPDYKCIWASVGTNGRSSDSAIWLNADLRTALSSINNPLDIPPPKALPGRSKRVPYVITVDDAFALTNYLLKPFPQSGLSDDQRIFNYRLSRMRRISENGFGLLANRWRVFRNAIQLPPETVNILILAALVLHNYLRCQHTPLNKVSNLEVLDREDGQGNILPGHWRNDEASWQEFRPSVVTTTQMKHGLLERSTCNILIMKVQSNGNGDNVV